MLTAFILAAFICAIFFSFMMNRLRRRKATYALYEVRDTLLLLVASEKISEDSKYFQFYYKRINMFLAHAPNIGIDDALKSYSLSQKIDGVSLRKTMERSRRETEAVLSLKELKDPEVAAVTQRFYEASKEMILAHSSLLRISYYLIKLGFSKAILSKFLPNITQRGLAVVKLAGEEAECLSHKVVTH